MSSSRIPAFAFLLLAGLTGCRAAAPRAERPVLDRLAAQRPVEVASAAQVEYLAHFATSAEAAAHARAVEAAGGQATAVDKEGRLLKLRAPAAALKTVTLAEATPITLNGSVRFSRADSTSSALTEAGDPAEAFLTARNVVGVEELLKRVPTADGRGEKVAILDTGIELGLPGVSTGDKLEGFYDFSGFGKVHPQPLGAGDVSASGYRIGDKLVRFADTVAPQTVTAAGLLDERDLATNYLTAGFSDLNGDGQPTTYAYLVGTTRGGLPAVWLDADGDGVIADAAREELTDYNTTKKHVDLMPAAAPSGAHPVAVTIVSASELQFHAVLGGHGTSCAIIVAGDGYANGRLRGMAPKATLLAYVLDVEGQDVYTIDQFLAMFADAKARGATHISSSWGFATADVASARFVGDWLDTEISGAGIVVGIAAGNGGPTTNSGDPDDYIPHRGFMVGAYVSRDQARNVYGWTGLPVDGVIHYSSFGPTGGGRAVPDVVSPLMTLVRGERGHEGNRFYGFGGTSSATPALIGAVTALTSALKQTGTAKIDARLIKLAVQATAHPLADTPKLRQGAGLIDVNAAYDTYRRLAAEQDAAVADTARRTPFAYELRAATASDRLPGKAEGLYLRRYAADAAVTVNLTAESKALVDALAFIEPVRVQHTGTFFDTPSFLPLQAGGATFSVHFDAEALARPGSYFDVIELARVSDGVVLLRIPVLVEIPSTADAAGALARVDTALTPLLPWRQIVTLAESSPLRFDGIAFDDGGNRNAKVGIAVRSESGGVVFMTTVALSGAAAPLALQTPRLPAGDYEVVVYRTFGQPAVIGAASVHGAFTLPAVKVLGAQSDGRSVDVALQAARDLSIGKAELALTGTLQTVTLTRRDDAERKGYYGHVDLPFNVEGVSVALRQTELDQAVEDFRSVEAVFVGKEIARPVYRGWLDVEPAGTPRGDVAFDSGTASFDVIAYPNIVDWAKVRTRRLLLDVETPLPSPLKSTDGTVTDLLRGESARRTFVIPDDAGLPAHATGEVTLYAKDGSKLLTLPVEL